MPFVPDAPAKGGGSFVPDQDPQWSDIPDNIMKGLQEAPETIMEAGKSLLTPWPMKAMRGVTDAGISGHPMQALHAAPGAPLAEGLVNTAKDYGAGELLHGDLSGAGQHAKQSIIEHPIKAGLDAATIAAPFLAPEAETVQGGIDNAAMRAERFAQQQAVKAMEGTRGQVMQIGPEAARDLGQFALDKGVVSPFKGEIGMEQALNDLDQKAGSQIGKFREIGDYSGGAPKTSELLGKIEQELRPQYASGMREGEEGGLDKAMAEVGKLQKFEELPPEIPDASGTQGFTRTEPNPLYTPVPKTLEVQNPIARAPIPGFERMPKWYQDKLLADQTASDLRITYKNPNFISDIEQLSSEEQIPRHGFEEFRGSQDAGTFLPEYKTTEPTFSDIAGKATEMNQYAKGMHQLNQPSGALTDSANILSRENNAALAKVLTPEQLTQYKTALSDYGSVQKLQEFFLRKEAREMAGRGGGIVRGLKDAFGHKIAATAADTAAGILSSPAVAKALPALSNAAKLGPGALETTHYMLQKNDADYAKETGGASSSGEMSSMLQNGPEALLSHVISNPAMAQWGPAFQDAASRGPQAIVANHFTLMQRDPKYNKSFTESMEEQGSNAHRHMNGF